MTEKEYLAITADVMKQLDMGHWRDNMDELIAALPNNALEYIIEEPEWSSSETTWAPEWLQKCRNELTERIILR